jgi:predicted Zn-dependent protease
LSKWPSGLRRRAAFLDIGPRGFQSEPWPELELEWPGSFPEASAALNVLSKSARTAREHDITARYLLYLGQVPEAERFAMQSVQIDPGRPSSWVTFAAVLGEQGKYESAVQLLTQALALSGHEATSGISEMIAHYQAEAGKNHLKGAVGPR